MVDEIMKVAGISLNMALEAAANEPQPPNRGLQPAKLDKDERLSSGSPRSAFA